MGWVLCNGALEQRYVVAIVSTGVSVLIYMRGYGRREPRTHYPLPLPQKTPASWPDHQVISLFTVVSYWLPWFPWSFKA